MKEFYEKFYHAVETSAAHHTFCERLYGKDLCQHGFVDLEQVELLLAHASLDSADHALDAGSGNGMLAEYMSDRTGAHFTGVDIIPEAIAKAQARTISKSKRLSFSISDINHLDLPESLFDIVAFLDSIYFCRDMPAVIASVLPALKGKKLLAFFYSYGKEPWVAAESFPKERLAAHQTPLAQALQTNRLDFQTWDLTEADYRLALLRKQILESLKDQFETEGNGFIFDSRIGDAEGVRQAIEAGLHKRYLYIAHPSA